MNGLYYFENIIPDIHLLNDIMSFLQNEFASKCFNVNENNPKSRRVCHFGFKYNYKTNRNNHEKAEDFPPIIYMLKLIADKVSNNIDNKYNSCIINEYLPGQGISAHIDSSEFGENIACFTFGSGIEIEFNNDIEVKKLYLLHNSLYVMTKDARYKYAHQIRPRFSDNGIKRSTRWSITFRQVLF